MPNLTYCVTFWGNSSNTALKPLITAHKRIVRSICSANFRHPTQPLMTDLGFLNIKEIYTYMSGNYVYKSLNALCNCDWFTLRQSTYSTRSIDRHELFVPFAHSWQTMNSLRIAGANIWNRLPAYVQECNTYYGFKAALKKTFVAIILRNNNLSPLYVFCLFKINCLS